MQLLKADNSFKGWVAKKLVRHKEISVSIQTYITRQSSVSAQYRSSFSNLHLPAINNMLVVFNLFLLLCDQISVRFHPRPLFVH